MSKSLHDVLVDILTYNGAVVEKTDDDCMDVIVPTEVSHILNIPEYARLRFSAGETCDNTVYASYDSDLFYSIKNLFHDKGKFTVTTFEPYIPNVEKISKVILEKTSFGNATFRLLDKTEISDVDYLLVFFKYSALSDEKHEGIISLLINMLNLSSLILDNNVSDILIKLKNIENGLQHKNLDMTKTFKPAYNACLMAAQERLKDFQKSLERRLNRDIKRVYEYYETLKEETVKAVERAYFDMSSADSIEKDLKGDVSVSKEKTLLYIKKVEREYLQKRAEIRRMLGNKTWELERNEKIDKLINKYSLVESEQKWKVQDLVSKYTLNIQIEPVSAILIKTQAMLFWLNIKRRLASRQFPLAYNPIIKQIDILPCESCFYPQRSYYICDDKLHIVCSECFKECPKCGKQYCNACYNKCPKCSIKQIQKD